MTRHDHLVNGREVATVRNFLGRYELAMGDEELDGILAVTDGGTLTVKALRTLLAEHDAYRSEATAVRAEAAPAACPARSWPTGLYACILTAGHKGSHMSGTGTPYDWGPEPEPAAPASAVRTPDKAVPAWAYDLLIAVLNHEDVHGSHDDGWMCFEPLLKAEVPQWEIEGARLIADYWAQKEKP